MPTSVALRHGHEKAKIKLEVFDLLQERGPLNVVQIALEVLAPTRFVMQCLEELKNEDLVVPTPDPGVDQTELLPEQLVWGICKMNISQLFA